MSFSLDANLLAQVRSLSDRGDLLSKALMAFLDNTYQITLTAAAEASNSITVTGQIKDMDGQNVAGTKDILITSKAPTGTGNLSDGGNGTVTAGSGSASCWMKTDANGNFQVAVANLNAEQTLVLVQLDNGQVESITLTFA
jgi:hypothetical protein